MYVLYNIARRSQEYKAGKNPPYLAIISPGDIDQIYELIYLTTPTYTRINGHRLQLVGLFDILIADHRRVNFVPR